MQRFERSVFRTKFTTHKFGEATIAPVKADAQAWYNERADSKTRVNRRFSECTCDVTVVYRARWPGNELSNGHRAPFAPSCDLSRPAFWPARHVPRRRLFPRFERVFIVRSKKAEERFSNNCLDETRKNRESKGKFWNQFWRNGEIRYFLPLRRNLVAFYSEFLNYFTFTVGSTELWFQRDLYTGKLAKHVTSERKFSRSFSF